jgi:methylmalonyl-CoA/ethylmalonyl-CoA epimerase
MYLRQVVQYAKDIDRAQRFYEGLLGKPAMASFNPPGFAFFDLGNTRLLLDVNGKSALIYLGVDDVRETTENLREQGYKIINEPHVVFPDDGGIFDKPGNEWLAFIEDSEGNMVGLMSREVTGE